MNTAPADPVRGRMFNFPNNETFIAFVVDTNAYAGNFEREMVAYMTGQVGECGVGKEMADIAASELDPEAFEWFEDSTRRLSDDTGCSRPASIWPSPGEAQEMNSVVVMFEALPPDIIDLLKARAAAYCARPRRHTSPKVLGFRVLEIRVTVEEKVLLSAAP